MNDQQTAGLTGLITAVGGMAVAFGYFTPMQDQSFVTGAVEAIGGLGMLAGLVAGWWQSSHPANAAAAARSIAATPTDPDVTHPVAAALEGAGWTVTPPVKAP